MIGDGLASGNADETVTFTVPEIDDSSRSCPSQGGGALFITSPANVAIDSDSLFENNTAGSSYGGAVFVTSDSTDSAAVVRVKDSRFGLHNADYYGGTIFSSLSILVAENTELNNLSTSESGIVYSNGAIFSCSSGCPVGKYGRCEQVDSCWSCDKYVCIDCKSQSPLVAVITEI